MVDIIKNLVDEKVLATLILLPGITRELRLFYKIRVTHEIELEKINSENL
ncbi:hypothetical protein IU402_00475 [Aerococcaceae bacterium zg-BR9]|nr:hypothetical protein [Aerococcaceae bacterium zg-BR9]